MFGMAYKHRSRWNRKRRRLGCRQTHQDDSNDRLYYAPTPKGWKIPIMRVGGLEELGIPYNVIPSKCRGRRSVQPEFLAISQNNGFRRSSTIAPPMAGGPFAVSSRRDLIYLADKTGRFLTKDMRAAIRVVQWVMWQMSALGPCRPARATLRLRAGEDPYAIERYRDEAARLYVLEGSWARTGAYVAVTEYTSAAIAAVQDHGPITSRASRSTIIPNAGAGMPRCAPAAGAGGACHRQIRKEPCDEEARRNMSGRPKEMAGRK